MSDNAMTWGGDTTGDERPWALMAHLSIFIFPVFGPLIVYLVKKDQSALHPSGCVSASRKGVLAKKLPASDESTRSVMSIPTSLSATWTAESVGSTLSSKALTAAECDVHEK